MVCYSKRASRCGSRLLELGGSFDSCHSEVCYTSRKQRQRLFGSEEIQ